MTFKTNIAPAERTRYYGLEGADTNSGASLEDPKFTAQAAIDAAAALTPPPQVGKSATVVTAQVGSFTAGIVLEDFISFDGRNATITISSPIVITLASFLNFEIRGVINTRDSATNFLIDGEDELGVTTLTSRTTGDNSKGFDITGSCGNLTFNSSDGSIGGDSSVGFSITSTTTVPITINTDSYTLADDNTTFIDFNPVSSTDKATVNIASLTNSASNTTGFLVQRGELTIESSGTLSADTIINIKSGGILNIPAGDVTGNIIIDVGGTLNASIITHVGTITNNGTINGQINNIVYSPEIAKSFKNINERDTFYAANLSLLFTDILITVKTGNNVTTFSWTGDDNPSTYDGDLWISVSLNAGPGTLFLGVDGANISSSGKGINIINAYDDTAMSVDTVFDPEGSTKTFEYLHEKEQTQIVSSVFSSTLSAPTNLPFAGILVSSFTDVFFFRPASTGTLRVRAYAGTDNTAPIVRDERLNIIGADIGNIVTILITGLLNNPGDDLFIEITGVDLFGGFQTSGFFDGQTVPWFQSTFSIVEPVRLLDRHDIEQTILLNPEYRTDIEKDGFIVFNTFPTSTTDTFTDGLFTAGIASTSNPTLITDGSGTFSANDIILITRGITILENDVDEGLYEVVSHVGTTLTVGGIGTTARTQDFVRDQFTFQQGTGFITKTKVAVLEATDTDVLVGFGDTMPLTFETLRNETMHIGGNFVDTTDQTISVANTGQDVTFNTNSLIDDISHTAGSATFTVNTTGVYNLIVAPQLAQGASAATVEFWIQKNGTAIVDSNVQESIAANSQSLPLLRWKERFVATDTFKIIWASNSTATMLDNITSTYGGPNIPSIMLGVTRAGS